MAESRNEAAAPTPPPAEQAVRVSRTIRASRHRVYRAWTDPELLMRWFIEPDGDMRVVEMDLRAGGRYRLEGRMGDKPWAVWGTYREVTPPSKLVYTWSWENDPALGEPLASGTVVSVEFHERGSETEVVVTHEGFATERARAEHDAGWIGCLDRLAAIAEQSESEKEKR
jgi:uncharacterized protein YndB with AHSA1/START domain